MDVHELVKRAIADPEFAAELHLHALRASRKGATADDWLQLHSHFVNNPRELLRLRESGLGGTARHTTTTTTTTTTTSVTSPVCTTTTLTTVTTIFDMAAPQRDREQEL